MLPRIRTVKPQLFRHEALYDLERETGLPIRLAFIGLFTCCDREGRFPWHPRELKTLILPYDDVDFSRVLDAWLTRGFVRKYTAETSEFGYIPSWNLHQHINNREAASEIPVPQELPLNCLPQQQVDACLTRAPRVPHGNTVSLQGREWNGREQEGNGSQDAELGADGRGHGAESAPRAPANENPSGLEFSGQYLRINASDHAALMAAFPEFSPEELRACYRDQDLWQIGNPARRKKHHVRAMRNWLQIERAKRLEARGVGHGKAAAAIREVHAGTGPERGSARARPEVLQRFASGSLPIREEVSKA